MTWRPPPSPHSDRRRRPAPPSGTSRHRCLKKLTPISLPLSLINGPPELPGFIGVCVWMTSTLCCLHSKSGRTWLIRPLVYVQVCPSGWPIAWTSAPTCASLMLPREIVATWAGTFSTSTSARSRTGSSLRTRPRIACASVIFSPSFCGLKMTAISCASPTTWALVSSTPDRLAATRDFMAISEPEPCALSVRMSATEGASVR